MNYQVDKWRGQVVTQNTPGAYRFVLTSLSDHASNKGLLKLTPEIYSDILKMTGVDAAEVLSYLKRAQRERRLTIYQPQQVTPSRHGDVVVELQ